jgi:hypothetical protein
MYTPLAVPIQFVLPPPALLSTELNKQQDVLLVA